MFLFNYFRKKVIFRIVYFETGCPILMTDWICADERRETTGAMQDASAWTGTSLVSVFFTVCKFLLQALQTDQVKNSSLQAG